MRKIQNILLGWWFWLTDRNNKMMQDRLKICLTCEYRVGLVCGSCGCVLKAKTRIPEEICPYSKWLPEKDGSRGSC